MRPLPELKWGNRGWLVALDVARGLHHLHTNKVIHCDLKTSVRSVACLSDPRGVLSSLFSVLLESAWLAEV